MVISTCSVCGETFLSKRKSTVCSDKSTCRVKKSRADKKAKLEAEKMMLPMEDYLLYEATVKRFPSIASLLIQQLKKNGKDALHMTLIALQYTLDIETSEVGN